MLEEYGLTLPPEDRAAAGLRALRPDQLAQDRFGRHAPGEGETSVASLVAQVSDAGSLVEIAEYVVRVSMNRTQHFGRRPCSANN